MAPTIAEIQAEGVSSIRADRDTPQQKEDSGSAWWSLAGCASLACPLAAEQGRVIALERRTECAFPLSIGCFGLLLDRSPFLGRSMRSYTLDTNCLIDLEENRPATHCLRQLVSAFQNGVIDLAVPAIMASENQRDGKLIENFSEFRRRIASLGLADATLLQPLAYADVTFFDYSLFTDDDTIELERRIHEVIHPEIAFAANAATSKTKWRNAKCDVQAIWSHIHNHRECFVIRARTPEVELRILKTMLRWATTIRTRGGQRLLAANPVAGIRGDREANPKRPVASWERFTAIRKAMKELAEETGTQRWIRMEFALVLSEATGRRIGSIRQLAWTDFDLEASTIRWRAEADKKRKQWLVPMPPTLLDEVKRFRLRLGGPFGRLVFPSSTDPTRPLGREVFRTHSAMRPHTPSCQRRADGTPSGANGPPSGSTTRKLMSSRLAVGVPRVQAFSRSATSSLITRRCWP